MVDMGNLGINLGARRATLIDINGDGLPDMLDTTNEGAHLFFLNVPHVDGSSAFNTTPVVSEIGLGSAFRLGNPTIQTLDSNGDGFTDLLNVRTGSALINRGNGDWERLEQLSGEFGEFGDSFEQYRFIDYDNDKRIDLMGSTQSTTTVFRNLGTDGFEVDEGVEPIGAGFVEDGLQFSDMNGDGLLDVVRVRPGGILYRLNYGWGRWSEEVEITGLPITDAQVTIAELEDINGDGLSDLVVVTGSSVTYALNNNTEDFATPVTLTSADVDGEIPPRDPTLTVVYADMNAGTAPESVKLAAELRGLGVRVALYPGIKAKMGKQFSYADSIQARYVALIGPDEVADGTVAIKNLATREQAAVPRHEVADRLLGRLETT